MTKRWKNRPAGSNWGEFGDDDQHGRMNYRQYSTHGDSFAHKCTMFDADGDGVTAFQHNCAEPGNIDPPAWRSARTLPLPQLLTITSAKEDYHGHRHL